jgi:trk system potassium uptake protein
VNFRAVLGILGFLLLIIGGMMLFSVPFALHFEGGDAHAIFLSAFITLGAGSGLWFGFKKHRHGMGKREGFLIAASGWAVASLFGCLPYMLSGAIPSFTDAYFETMSGFTTTGATILVDIEAVPKGLLFWRSTTQWIGGMGILLLSIAILPLLGVGGMQLFSAEVTHVTVEKLTPRISQTARILWTVYLVLTVLVAGLLMIGGLGFFDALAHAFTTIATGGFSTKNDSIAHFQSPFVHYVIIAFMFLSGASYMLHFRALRGRSLKAYARDNEFTFYAVTAVVATLVVFIGIGSGHHAGLEERFRGALFQVVTLVSSSGFVTNDYALWAPGIQMLLLFLMVQGGCAGSTSGGMKVARSVLLLKSWKIELRKLVHPKGIFVVRYNDRSVGPDVVTAVQGFLVAYVSIFALCTVIMASLGLDLVSAASAVVSALSNIGPGLGSVGPTETYAGVPEAGKWVLAFCMLMGRLELFTVLVLFAPSLWRR